MATIYDGAFRTILNDCRKLIIPVINEIFSESFTGEEEIQFFPNEHFIDQKDEADKERITDTNFTVLGKTQKKYHIECESSLPDGKIMIRLFEYDAQITLDEGDVTEETLTVTFPNTAVSILSISVHCCYILENYSHERKCKTESAVTGIKQGINQGISQGIIQGVNETKKKTALIMLQDGELPIEKIANADDFLLF